MAESPEIKVRITADTSELDAALERAQARLDEATGALRSDARADEAWLQVVTNGRSRDTKVYVVFRDGRRHRVCGIKRVELNVGLHDVTTGVIHCDLACELTGHKEI